MEAAFPKALVFGEIGIGERIRRGGLMKRGYRIALLALVVAALTILMVGCSSGAASSGASASASSDSSASASAESASSEASASVESASSEASASAESASSAADEVSSEASSSASFEAAGSTDGSIGSLKLASIPGASFKPVEDFAAPDEMSQSDVEDVERAIRAYTPPSQPSLLINNAKSFYYYEQLDAKTKNVYEGLLQLLSDPTTTDYAISIPLAGFASLDEFEDCYYLAYFCLTYDHPEFFWAYNAMEVNVVAGIPKDESERDKVYLYLEEPYKNYEKEMTAFNSAVDEFLADIDMNATDSEKALAIHDKLCGMVTYDTAEAESVDATSNLAHTAYGALVENSSGEAHLAVCDGYSLAYEYLLQQAGIEAIVLVGEGGAQGDTGAHAWNLVKLDGEWYEVDSTWDDGITEYKEALAEAKKQDPSNEAIPYYEEALNDEVYYNTITHYMYNLTTKAISDYTPPVECTYVFKDGAALTIPEPSVHIRASKLEGYKYYSTMVAMAPEAAGTKYVFLAK